MPPRLTNQLNGYMLQMAKSSKRAAAISQLAANGKMGHQPGKDSEDQSFHSSQRLSRLEAAGYVHTKEHLSTLPNPQPPKENERLHAHHRNSTLPPTEGQTEQSIVTKANMLSSRPELAEKRSGTRKTMQDRHAHGKKTPKSPIGERQASSPRSAGKKRKAEENGNHVNRTIINL